MKYVGGKVKLAKIICSYLNQARKSNQLYIEPFVGGGSILAGINKGPNLALDYCKSLIELWRKLQEGWQPPNFIEEDDYHRNHPLYLQAFIGFGCSFGGKYFGGYARNSERNYAREAKIALLQKINSIHFDTEFICLPYWRLNPKNALIYCDPPYAGTLGYDAIEQFDSDLFWWTMKQWSKTNTIFVSEQQAPKQFRCIWMQSRIRTIDKDTTKRAKEKLFTNV